MKKILTFVLFASVLSFVSCDKKGGENPSPKFELTSTQEVEAIENDFKTLKNIFDNLGKDKTVALAEFEKFKNNIILKDNSFKYFIEDACVTDAGIKGKRGKFGNRILNGFGIEPAQLFKKGMVGAFQISQFNKARKQVLLAKGKEAREAEMKKAVAYLFSGVDLYKTKDQFKADANEFGKYMLSVAGSEKFKGIDKDIISIIKTIFENIEKDDVVSAQLLELNEKVNTVVIARCIHYLTYGEKLKAELDPEVAHELSEGLGFFYGMPALENNEGKNDVFVTLLENGFVEGGPAPYINLYNVADAQTWCVTWSERLIEKFVTAYGEESRFTVADVK